MFAGIPKALLKLNWKTPPTKRGSKFEIKGSYAEYTHNLAKIYKVSCEIPFSESLRLIRQ